MKKFIITEEEKKQIKKLYNLIESAESDALVNAIFKQAMSPKDSDSKDDSNSKKDSETTKTDYSTLTSSGDDFIDITKKVIDKFEGGYWNPGCAKFRKIKSPHPRREGMYKNSTETMYGLDRYAGAIENSPDGKTFFEKIDAEKINLGAEKIPNASLEDKKNGNDWTNMEKFCTEWKYNHIPSGSLKNELLTLAAKKMKDVYEKNVKAYFKGNTQKVVESSKPLMLHFSYATWNGPVAFRDFAKSINDAVEKGKSINELIEIAKEDRIKKYGSTAWADATKRVNAAIDAEKN